MKDAEEIIIAGESAGGLACMYYLDYIKTLFSENIKILGVCDSGVFLDVEVPEDI